jgi:hypothetical protein
MPTLYSHTQLVPTIRDCQVAPAHAQTKAWQRVCLSNCTTKTTYKPTVEKNTEAITAGSPECLGYVSKNHYHENPQHLVF